MGPVSSVFRFIKLPQRRLGGRLMFTWEGGGGVYTVTSRQGVRIKLINGVARSLCEVVGQYVIKIVVSRK